MGHRRPSLLNCELFSRRQELSCLLFLPSRAVYFSAWSCGTVPEGNTVIGEGETEGKFKNGTRFSIQVTGGIKMLIIDYLNPT